MSPGGAAAGVSTVPRIVLVRHGPSSHLHNGGPVDRDGVQRWRDARDAAGIKTTPPPPRALLDVAGRSTHIVSSDLPRALTSAEVLAPKRPVRVSHLFREIPLAIPPWPTRLPLVAWEALVHVAWSIRIARGTDTSAEERARGEAAAAWLGKVVGHQGTALVVTHGVFRRLLAMELQARGWTAADRRGGYGHWSSWTFSRLLRP